MKALTYIYVWRLHFFSSQDNCPGDANADQMDSDEDGIGNVCGE